MKKRQKPHGHSELKGLEGNDPMHYCLATSFDMLPSLRVSNVLDCRSIRIYSLSSGDKFSFLPFVNEKKKQQRTNERTNEDRMC